MAYNHPIGSIYHLHTRYTLPSGGLLSPFKRNHVSLRAQQYVLGGKSVHEFGAEKPNDASPMSFDSRFLQQNQSLICCHMLHVWGIFTYICPKCMVNVGRYFIHLAFGHCKLVSPLLETFFPTILEVENDPFWRLSTHLQGTQTFHFPWLWKRKEVVLGKLSLSLSLATFFLFF